LQYYPIVLRAATLLLILNVLDAAFTLAWTTAGMAREANPLMVEVLGHSPVLFMVAKLALVSLGVFLLVRLRGRSRRLAVASMVACGCVYAGIFVYHVSALPQLIAAI
jgi:cytochrome bd-type quinol oxidase subunit 2